MKIKVNESWFIEPHSKGGFDLIEKRMSEKEKPYEVNHGYNMTMNRCIKVLAHNNICSNDNDVTLSEFIRLYRHEVTKIENLVSL